MQKFKFGKKFPWKTALLGIAVVVLAVILIGVLFPEFGAWLIGGALWLGTSILNLLVACFTNIFFLGGLGVGLAVFFIYFYRKNYSMKTGYRQTGTGIGTGATRDSLAEADLFDDDMKVESA